MAITDIIVWLGILLSLSAKILMANKRFVAVKILMVGTAISAAWALHLSDYQSLALHVISIGLQVRTLRAWNRGK